MRRFLSTICAAAIAVTSLAALTPTGRAAPAAAARVTVGPSNDVTEVRHRRGFERRNGVYYYNGHRGHRQRRAGWRRHNGFWFPPSAFIAGVIVGGGVVNRPLRLSDRHFRWCANQYRSYRVSDNSWKPVGQPRRRCNSPFD